MEPIIQVGFNPVCSSYGSLGSLTPAQQATIAGQLVAHLNQSVYLSNPIQNWIISNEPENPFTTCASPLGFNYDNTGGSDASNIAQYIKDFATQMKNADPSITIIGPELTTFGNSITWKGNTLMSDLISTGTYSITGKIPAGNVAYNKYYIDVLSFHYYPNYTATATGRPDVIADPTLTHDGFKNKLSSNVAGTYEGLAEMIVASGRTIDNLKIACTEFNLLYDTDDNLDESVTADYATILDGFDSRSFLAGQWMTEIFAQAMNTYTTNSLNQKESWVEFMNLWSVQEGADCHGSKGYLGAPSPACSVSRKRPEYWHYWLMANHFKGTFYMGNVGSGGANIKAYAAKSCNGINIMIMNQNKGTGSGTTTLKINLNGTLPSGTGFVGIQFGTTTNKVAATTGISETINYEETLVIECDPCGKPLGRWKYSHTDNAPLHALYNGYQRSCVCANGNSNTSSPLRCSNTDTSTVTHPTKIVTGNLVISDSMWVPNTIRVPNGATLTINNAEVVFSSGAKIYTDPPTYSSPGGQVIIMNSYLHGCDGANWQGITVSNHNDSGYVPITIQQSTIHDALVAVHADSVTGGIITASEFSNGATAMQLNNCKNFTIDNNSIGEYATGIQTTNTMAGPSSISGNFITGVNTAISMLNDNHSGLTISCNDLYNYTGYGVHSTNCTLKNQGTALQGAGNIFTSSSLLLNNKFSHSGNNITYYTDPSYPFTLVSGIGMNASTVLAQADGCGGSSRMENESEQAATQLNITPDKAAILSTVPNPATEQAAIFFNLGKDNVAGEIVLTNVFGEIISRFKVNTATNKIDIDCTKMPNGIYFTSLLINGKIAGTKKMMIAR